MAEKATNNLARWNKKPTTSGNPHPYKRFLEAVGRRARSLWKTKFAAVPTRSICSAGMLREANMMTGWQRSAKSAHRRQWPGRVAKAGIVAAVRKAILIRRSLD